MMAKVLTRLVSCLVAISEIAKANAANSTSSAAGWKLARPGRTITSTPRKPSTMLPMRLLRHAFAEHQRGQQRDPGRHGEFEREHRGERQQRHRQRPAELPDEMRGVARKMQPMCCGASSLPQLRPQRRCSASSTSSADAAADRQDFEDAQLLRRSARIDTALDRKRQQGADHPEDDAAELRCGHDAFVGCWRGERACVAGDAGAVTRRRAGFPAAPCRRPAASCSAASTATIFGKASSGTLSRRALYICGTRQISASVTLRAEAIGPGRIIVSSAVKPSMTQW